jgi:hypothetical protein
MPAAPAGGSYGRGVGAAHHAARPPILIVPIVQRGSERATGPQVPRHWARSPEQGEPVGWPGPSSRGDVADRGGGPPHIRGHR